ncbi:aspartyl protease family protein [Brevundimonas viscosa]|uniref:Aspartyl protease n=1 Tax=Brevundimonas viscosa TaxID=871741 RepID=A0A1I6NYL7_9CAUL|nr:aspartyl protease family protein [Brevundimonas viscosa]SFS32940.1 Aspartyl protease [Brevundimonas viscosa]
MRGLDRRLLLAGLGAGAAASAWPARAQDPEPSADAVQPVQLLANLFTRVGAAVTINGRGPFVFVIDTGAGATAISDTLAAQLELPAREPVLVHGITTATRTESVAVDRLLLSGLSFRDLRCPVLPAANLGADGLLGLDVLGRFRLSFDVMRRSASLTIRGVRILMGGADMTTGTRLRRGGLRSARGRFGQLILTQVTVEGVPTAAFIDSGAQYSIGNTALQRAVASLRNADGRLARVVPLYGVTGQSLSADLARVSDLRLGATRLGSTPLLFADLHCFRTLELADRPALLIGADLLGRFRHVVLDFSDGTVSFEGLRRQTTRTIEDELRR